MLLYRYRCTYIHHSFILFILRDERPGNWLIDNPNGPSGITGGAILVIALVAFCYGKTLKFCCSNFVPGSLSLGSTSSSLQRGTLCFDVPLFSYKDLEQATNNFHESKELGSGGFGRVYKGKLIITFAQHPPPKKKGKEKGERTLMVKRSTLKES